MAPVDLRDQLHASIGENFIIERELDGGGMSRVFVARDARLGRTIAVKVLPPEMAAAVSVERFQREIALLAKLQHPHVVPLLQAGDADGVPYYTMPFVDGESLRARYARIHGSRAGDRRPIARCACRSVRTLDLTHKNGHMGYAALAAARRCRSYCIGLT